MTRLLLTLFLCAASALLIAQSFYNVRVGTYQDVKFSDFNEIQALGFVYGTPRAAQLTEVYIGNYSSQDKARQVAEQLKTRGFGNALPLALPDTGSRPGQYIQIALRARDRTPDWKALQRAGTLFVDATDGVTKIVTGPYPDAATTATELAKIKALGYRDAFSKTLDAARLIPVGTFETGIKRALIPIDLAKAPPVTEQPATQDTAPAAPPTPAPAPTPAVTLITPTAKEPAAPTPAPASPEVTLPEIDVKTKRHSAAELQRVLKEKGFYNGSVDGYYGEGTRNAYQAAWLRMIELEKYRRLADAPTLDGPVATNWPETLVLTTIADDLAAGLGNAELGSTLRGQRETLLAQTSALSATKATAARNWENGVWANLDEWATEDPLHARILSALRVTYYQTQVRLEAMYAQRGLTAIESRDLATAALENMLSASLERFE